MIRLDRRHQLAGRFEIEPGDEAGGPEHAERIVGEGLHRVERGPQAVFGEIGEAAVRVDELELGQAQRHRIDREVPTGEIVFDDCPRRRRPACASPDGTPRPGAW